MISDSKILAEVVADWTAVRKLCNSGHPGHVLSGGGAPVFFTETPPEGFYNLPFLLAYAVLDQVLSELIDQGTIQCNKKRPLLGDKMAASINVLPWQDYAQVESGKAARNALAHEGVLLRNAACFGFINAVESELKAWAIL